MISTPPESFIQCLGFNLYSDDNWIPDSKILEFPFCKSILGENISENLSTSEINSFSELTTPCASIILHKRSMKINK
jgi:hypothetical protein